ncbi:hypothetical protein TSOC_002090 [Tetrabaena socialis]|uniref:Uncharacterized protein n=1 Tax=Tetrabaena socialis TaxID=47790 RepID=A0A2J8AF29_9CHLO|nr:hypothetical protein TSOC_002090 [Tetrabaena socialis]|eukprot:PNH11106.1 hypothetical protein TSOC_002090 [Tetrabaena socialis]
MSSGELAAARPCFLARTDASGAEQAAVVEPAPAPVPVPEPLPETIFYEGPGSNAELILSLLLIPTLVYAPLSITAIGRRVWVSFRFTNKRVEIINTSPLSKRTLEITYDKIKEAAPARDHWPVDS